MSGPVTPSSALVPEEGKALQLVLAIALFGIIGWLFIEALEAAHRARSAGGLQAWWQSSPSAANQRKAD